MVFITKIVLILAHLVPVIVSVAFFTLAERKVMGALQRRRGPNLIGFWGFLQPFADAIKLVIKEFVFPKRSNLVFFLAAPVLTLFLALSCWSVVPLSSTYVYSSINLGVFFIFSLSSLNVYGVILAGWASNSRYAILGCLRSAAQIVSYEIPLGFVLLTVVLCAGSFDMLDIVYAQAYTGMFGFGLLPVVPVFLVSLLAETNRAPFDLPEAEAELVAGFNVEYSSLAFALFFLGEYCNMLLMSTLCCLFFLSGWLLPSTLNSLGFFIVAEELVLSLKVSFICFLLVFVRANYPRYRYDQLLFVGWKVLVPISFSFFIAIVFILFFCGGLSGF